MESQEVSHWSVSRTREKEQDEKHTLFLGFKAATRVSHQKEPLGTLGGVHGNMTADAKRIQEAPVGSSHVSYHRWVVGLVLRPGGEALKKWNHHPFLSSKAFSYPEHTGKGHLCLTGAGAHRGEVLESKVNDFGLTVSLHFPSLNE